MKEQLGSSQQQASISCHCDRAGHLCVHREVTVKFQPQRAQHSGSFLAAGSLQPQESWLRGPEGASCLQSPGSAQRGEAETGKTNLAVITAPTSDPPKRSSH